MANTREYCRRMGESIPVTTKNKIPELVRSCNVKTILDVGCADGRFTEFLANQLPRDIRIDAIDPNVEKYMGVLPTGKTKKITYHAIRFDDGFTTVMWEKKYDCIVFSSVMHEISSYHEDENKRYSQRPIFNALQIASKLLNPGGIVVVRDMVKQTWKTKPLTVEMSPYNAGVFLNFIAGCPYLGRQYDPCPETKFMAYDSGNRILFNIRNDVLMEFLMTATWGPESMEREIREKKFILKKTDWMRAFNKAGLNIEHYEDTNEEYPKYFDRLVKVWEPKWKYPMTTCLIVGRKP